MADEILSLQVSLDDQASSSAKSATDALNSLGDAADVVSEKVTRSSKSFASVNKLIDDQAILAAKTATANRNYQASLQAVNDELDRGGITADEAADKEARLGILRDNAIANAQRQASVLRDMFDAQTAANTATSAGADIATQAAARTSATADAIAKATQSQAAYNQALGVSSGSSDYAKRAADLDAYGTEMDRVRAKYDPLFAASKAYEAVLNDLDTALKTGAISLPVYEAAQKRMNDALAQGKDVAAAAAGNVGQATGSLHEFSLANAGALREVLVLGHELTQGNFSRFGSSLFVLAERSGGLVSIFSGLQSVVTSVGGVFAILATAALGAVAVVADHVEEQDRAYAALGERLRATTSDYMALARAATAVENNVASTSTLSNADSRTTGNELVSLPRFQQSKQDLGDLIRLSADLAATWAKDLPDATKMLSAAIQDPTAELKKLMDDGFVPLDVELLRSVGNMQALGDRAGATTAVIGAMRAGVKGAADEALTPLQADLHALGEAFHGVDSGGKSFADTLAGPIIMAARTFVVQIKEIVDAAKDASDWFSRDSAQRVQDFRDAYKKTYPNDPSGPPGGVDDRVTRQGAMQSYDALRDSIATQYGVNPQAAAMVFDIEHRYNPDGTFANSDVPGSHATGPFQVQPGTFADMQQKYGFAGGINDPEANTRAGILYYRDRLEQNNGNVAAAYYDYHDGPGRALTGQAPSAAAKDAALRVGLTSYGGSGLLDQYGPSPAPGLPQYSQEIAKQTAGTLPQQLDAATTKLQEYQKAIKAANDAGISSGPAYNTLVAGGQAAQAALNNLLDPLAKTTRGLTDQLLPTQGLTGAALKLAQAQNAVTLEARNAGRAATDDDYTARQTAEQGLLNQAFEQTVATLQEQVAGEQQINSAYQGGAASVIQATNAVKAEAEARKYAKENTSQYAEEVGRLTDLYNQESAAKADATTLAQGFAQNNELQTIETEASLIGKSNDQRTNELALLKERQRIIGQGGDVNSAASQASFARISQINAETEALKVQQNAMGELQNFGVEAFDTISNSITTAFANGSLKALDFGAVFRSVISSLVSEVLKLSILNPVLNALLGGDHRTTLGDVSGLVGTLLGNNSATVSTTSADAFSGSGLAGSVDASGNVTTSGGTAATAAASGSGSILNLAGTLGTLAKGADWLSGGKLLSGLKDALGVGSGKTLGETVSTWLGETTQATQASVAAGFDAAGTSVNAAGQVGSDVAATQLTGTIGSAVDTIAAAIPYVASVATVITDLAQGNYKGAALVAVGAAIGTAILPGLGTAIGAAAGSIAGLLLPNHPLNPFETVDLNAASGQLALGKVASQNADPTAVKSSVQVFADGINHYMAQVGIQLANADGRLGQVGFYGSAGSSSPNANQGNLVQNVADLFKTLRFTDSTNDGSNFSIAKAGALPGQQFDDIQGLQTALMKVANFSDSLDALGLQLKSVGNDLVNIQVAGLKGPAQNDFQTALQNDLPGQTFATLDAFQAEVTKVATFVGTTYPSLLDPVIDNTTQLQSQIQAMVKTYQDAIAQAKSYGLATDGLTVAQGKAIALLQVPALNALAISNQAITTRGYVAQGANPLDNQLTSFDLDAAKQRDDLANSYKDIYGSLIPDAKEYGVAAVALDKTLAAERLNVITQFNASALAASRASQDTNLSLYEQFIDIRDRAAIAANNGVATLATDTDAANVKAIEETKKYSRDLLDYYGQAYASTADYKDRMIELANTQNAELLAIQQKYNQQVITDHNAVASVVTSLQDYATTLQTGTNSPLSAQAQLKLASQQFNAVSGAAAAGDYNSLSQIQKYADSFLTASRAVNGSGAAYVADYNKVLDALSGVANASQDTLTASYQASLMQNQTDQLVGAIKNLQAEVAKLRVETAQSNATPARVA